MRPARLRLLAALAVAGVGAGACSGDATDEPQPLSTTTTTVAGTTTTTAPPVEQQLDDVDLALEEIAVVESPTALARRPSSPDLYVAEQSGRVRVIDVTEGTSTRGPRYQLLNTPVLDLSDEVLAEANEQGLVGLAFSSDGRTLYVDFTAQPDGRTKVVEFQLGDGTRVDLDSRRELLEVDQPAPNHNGGTLAVGADGYLYIALGDGGGAGDPQGNGQDPTTLLGSILRIDPLGGEPYGIPPGNPFADGDDGRPETWLYGVRNPWQLSFDPETGDLWVPDVGENAREELNRLRATDGFDAGRGANLGWNAMEGTRSFAGDNPEGALLPIFEYGRDEGCSIIGGFVYRGEAIESLSGAYVFGDYCAPGIRAIQLDGDAVVDARTWDLGVSGMQAFGRDSDGELFVLLESGSIQKVVPGD